MVTLKRIVDRLRQGQSGGYVLPRRQRDEWHSRRLRLTQGEVARVQQRDRTGRSPLEQWMLLARSSEDMTWNEWQTHYRRAGILALRDDGRASAFPRGISDRRGVLGPESRGVAQ